MSDLRAFDQPIAPRGDPSTAGSSPASPKPFLLVIFASAIPMFLVALNNLVVTNALPAIGEDFNADQQGLQWVVNAYVLAFAGLLLTAAGIGDRFGRKRTFIAGTIVFVVGSVVCAFSFDLPTLLAGRVVQGIGAAAVLPLSLTLLSAEVPKQRRAAAVGIWSGINGLGVALGPLVGGAVTDGLDWKWVFWVNVPVAVIGIALTVVGLRESTGDDRGLDLVGMITIAGSVTLLVWAIVRAAEKNWGETYVVASFVGAAALLAAFVVWESRVSAPLLPLRFYRIRAFVLSNVVSLAMYFGVFGSIFFLVQYMQGPLGFSASGAGVRTLPWTAMPMLVAPLAGIYTGRFGGGRLMAAGLGFEAVALAWIATIATPDLDYGALVAPMIVGGVGMGLVFAPTTAVVLSSVREGEAGKASGAVNTVREVGGALGTAVLTTVYTCHAVEATASPSGEVFVEGMKAAIWVGVAVVAVGAVVGLFIPKQTGDIAGP